jgi:DNA-3-methyladenine glycosylase
MAAQGHSRHCYSAESSCVTVLPANWFARPAPVVAPELLGCVLVRTLPCGGTLRGLIVETEAYTQDDPACHGFDGRLTPARRVLFGQPGLAYVYFTYGMQHCFNVVTDRNGYASAVLVRALALDSLPAGMVLPPRETLQRAASGPGKLCRLLEIDRQLNGTALVPASGLWIEQGSASGIAPATASCQLITQTTRIGISRGVDLPWRWFLEGHPAVSRLR